jgi:hypothetical protein
MLCSFSATTMEKRSRRGDDHDKKALRCFCLSVLSSYGAEELTALYCQTDDPLYEVLPPAITWQRTRTLGRGDECCDFRWQRNG